MPEPARASNGVAMRALIGIDTEGKFKGAIALLRRLDFADTQWNLAHCRPSLAPNPIAVHLEVDEALELSDPGWSEARCTLEAAKCLLPGGAPAPTVLMVEAAPSAGLLQVAEEEHADLIAIGSHEYGRLGSLILDSTARALAIGSPVSFLVGRGHVTSEGPVKAVFATDHSAYANSCLDQLLEWRPRGLAEIIFVTATEMLELSDTVQYMNLLDAATQQGMTLSEYTVHSGKMLVERATRAGYHASYEPRLGFVGQAIENAMHDHAAHLLILGAQGHGFLERLLIGSVALDLVVSARCSTLVIRVVKPPLSN